MPRQVKVVGIPVDPEKPLVVSVRAPRRKSQVETGFVTVKELAERMEVTTACVRKWLDNGRRRVALPDDLKDTIPEDQCIPPEVVKRQGRRYLISLEWLKDFGSKRE